MEVLLSWLITVSTLCSSKPDEDGDKPKDLQYLRPPVFIVGTHADQPHQDIKEMELQIKNEIIEKKCQDHVIRPFYSVDNTQGSSDEGVTALQKRMIEVLKEEPYMGEEIPLRWLNFEKVIDALLSKQIYYLNVDQLQVVARDKCFIANKEEFNIMVKFYHDLGVIIKHGSTVILKAQWLIDLFRQLIIIPHFDEMDPVVGNHWKKVQDTGILNMELVDHVFKKFVRQGIVRDDILNMMEHFDLIAKFSPSSTDVKYFVPGQLNALPDSISAVEPSSSDPCPLYIHFFTGFVPHGLFSQVVSRTIRWCSEMNTCMKTTGQTRCPKLYLNGARFIIGRQIIHDFILICKKRFIKIVLKQKTQSRQVSADNSTATRVQEFLEETLQDLSRNLPYLRELQYQFCPYCQLQNRKCTNHNEMPCPHEDCLHLLDIKQGEPLICEDCEDSLGEILTVDGLKKWSSQRTSQALKESLPFQTLQKQPENKSPETASDPPEVTVTLLKKEDLPKKSKPWDDIQLPVDILLLAANECAFLACLSYLNPDFFKSYIKDLGHVYLGDMDEDKFKLRIAVMQCDVGSTCPGGSAVVVLNAVRALMPKAVFCVGLCGGLNINKVKLGDVVVLKKLITYAHSKVTENGIEQQGVKVPLKRFLSKLALSPDEGWKAPLKDPKDLKVQVHCGAFLSGPEVVDSNERCEALIKRFPEAVAIEMEGEGLYAAAHDLDIEWIVIKGVSNYADGRKSETDSWKQFASLMAASLTAHILSDHIVFQDWPHYESAKLESKAVPQKRKKKKVAQTFCDLQQMQHETAGKIDLSDELKNIASYKGFVVSENLGLGNCMFYALSEQLELVKGIRISHENLRQTIVQFLKDNPTLQDGTKLFNFVHGYSSWDAYCIKMMADGTWGDHLILHGAANCFNTCIHVISSLSHQHDLIISPECECDVSRNRLVLGHVHELHYVSLIKPKRKLKTAVHLMANKKARRRADSI